ncbi:MAG: hypothetical protein HKN47_21940 [Pirellulaceae bacterium]|nr:hypothetical protein [Pirellulaceae bacterium]
MSENQESDATGPLRVAPTAQLSRRGLIISLALMVCVGITVYALFPDSVGGPPLPVNVTVDRQPMATNAGGGATLTEVVVIENLAEHPISRLSIEINGQYLLHRDPPLDVGEKLQLAQRVFTDKRSSQRYNPIKYPAKEVMVTGQLPSGARGVSKFDLEPQR